MTWGPTPEEIFYRALKKGTENASMILILRDIYRETWKRALKRFEDEQKMISEITGREK
jgi:hypothetical protein